MRALFKLGSGNVRDRGADDSSLRHSTVLSGAAESLGTLAPPLGACAASSLTQSKSAAGSAACLLLLGASSRLHRMVSGC